MSPSWGGVWEAPAEAADRPPFSSWTSYFEFRDVGPTAPVTERCSLYGTQLTGAFPPLHVETKSNLFFDTCFFFLGGGGTKTRRTNSRNQVVLLEALEFKSSAATAG